jgi:hypothetical protein
MYISRSALLVVPKPIGPPNGEGFVGPDGFIAVVDAAGFFAWCFAAKAADVDKLRMARLTMMVLFMLELLWNLDQVPAQLSRTGLVPSGLYIRERVPGGWPTVAALDRSDRPRNAIADGIWIADGRM